MYLLGELVEPSCAAALQLKVAFQWLINSMDDLP